jgi:hypothetical protein
MKFGMLKWHINCFNCSNCNNSLKNDIDSARLSPASTILCASCVVHFPDAQKGFQHVSRLKQYVYLLRVALARLLNMLKEGGTLPHTSGRIVPPRKQYCARLLISPQMILI